MLNADSPGFDDWRERPPVRSCPSACENADHLWPWQPPESAVPAQIELDGQTWPVPLPGEHNGANLAAAVLAARSCGLTDDDDS